MEQDAQIGQLVKQRQTQRVAVEHLKLRGKKIADAYSAFGSGRSRWAVDDQTGRGNVYLVHPARDEREHPQYVLSHDDLAAYIRELAQAEQALAEINRQLLVLGIPE